MTMAEGKPAELKPQVSEVDRLKEENAKLRKENAELKKAVGTVQMTSRPVPHEPSFGLSEGTRTDLEQVEETTDPFTGKTVTRSDVKK